MSKVQAVRRCGFNVSLIDNRCDLMSKNFER